MTTYTSHVQPYAQSTPWYVQITLNEVSFGGGTTQFLVSTCQLCGTMVNTSLTYMHDDLHKQQAIASENLDVCRKYLAEILERLHDKEAWTELERAAIASILETLNRGAVSV